MNEPIYKKIEVIGISDVSIEAAVNNAVATSDKSIRNIKWFEVGEIRGSVKGGQVGQWQVGLKLAFTVDENPSAELGIERVKTEEFAREAKTPIREDSGKKIV